LTELDSANLEAVRVLATHWSQHRFVSPMARTFADLLAVGPDDAGQPYVPWYRVVIADDEVVGFVLMLEPTPTHPIPYLWRFLIDRRHQRRGIGTRVLDLVTDRCRQRGDQVLRVHYGQGPGNPSPLYLNYGFVTTGRVLQTEIESVLRL
jgi:GNAT superfamily N-acetyltransferase